ncbi:MAG: CBS domain-containing protein, partial [Candidatus Competibacteraceae bacterium]|nr:CBS domain-containing protein [Candidatus Competibacteraceae bacterium]
MKSASRDRLEGAVISPSASIAQAIAQLDKAGMGALALCASEWKLWGLLTDGDIRRALLLSVNLEEPCGTVANRTPVFALAPISTAEALHLLNQHDINHLPVVDADGQLQDFLLRKDLVTEAEFALKAKERIESVIVLPTASLEEAITRLNEAGTGALVLCAQD